MGDTSISEVDPASAWRFSAWLSMYPLNRASAMDYFRHSHFYDSDCNNEVIELQAQGLMLDAKEVQEKLMSMIGTEYQMDENPSSERHFIIRKQLRTGSGSDDLVVLALYYIVGSGPLYGTIFPLPSVHTVLANNLVRLFPWTSKYLSESNTGIRLILLGENVHGVV